MIFRILYEDEFWKLIILGSIIALNGYGIWLVVLLMIAVCTDYHEMTFGIVGQMKWIFYNVRNFRVCV